MSTATVQFPVRTTSPASAPLAARPRPTRRSAAASEAIGAVRLTRRGRVVVFATCLAAVVGGYTLMSDPAASTHSQYHAAAHRVIVQPGQTLWDIAKQVAPGQDPRTVIDEIVDLNALGSAGDIRAGQPLFVPAR